jgi:hypothetical protein
MAKKVKTVKKCKSCKGMRKGLYNGFFTGNYGN